MCFLFFYPIASSSLIFAPCKFSISPISKSSPLSLHFFSFFVFAFYVTYSCFSAVFQNPICTRYCLEWSQVHKFIFHLISSFMVTNERERASENPCHQEFEHQDTKGNQEKKYDRNHGIKKKT